MKIVIPLAGRGSRFQHLTKTPKPLIEVAGKPMIQWPIESLTKLYPEASSKDFVLICLKEHEEKYGISNELKRLIGSDITLRYIDKVTEGAACTVLTAEEIINNDEDILTCDCDQYFICRDFNSIRKMAIKKGWSGLVPVFKSDNPAYSYLKTNQVGDVTQTAEKQVISNHAAIGIYYFTQGKHFIWAAKEMMKKNIRFKNEFYMCPVYNHLIERGDVVRLVPTKEWMTLGTPVEAELFSQTILR